MNWAIEVWVFVSRAMGCRQPESQGHGLPGDRGEGSLPPGSRNKPAVHQVTAISVIEPK